MNGFDRAGIAERLRELLRGQDHGDLALTAARLGVEEVSLRMSIDPESPHPTMEVLAAVIGEYGLDPTWLLTGVYNARTHHEAIENGEVTEAMLRAQLRSKPPRVSEPTREPMRGLDSD